MSALLEFDNLIFIPGLNRGRYPFCHSLYIRDSVTAIIDPASDRETLLKFKKERGISIAILSHYHEDHFAFLHLLEGAKLWMPTKDAPPFENLDLFMEWYGMDDEQEIAVWKEIIQKQFNFRERKPDRTFGNNETFQFGATRMQTLHTPGHTPGHTCFYFPEQKLLFLADLDLTRFGPWYGDKYSDIDEIIASVERMREVEANLYITGHEDGVIRGDPGDLWDKYLGVIGQREARLREFIREPRTMGEIVNARLVYGKEREPKTFYDFGERATMLKHLERMIRRGEAAMEEDRYRLIG